MDRFAQGLIQLGHVFERALSVSVGIALAGFAVTVIVEIFFRYFIGSSLYWSNEVATYLFIYMVLFGGSVALKKGGLINVAFVKEMLSPKWQKVASVLMSLIMLGFSLLASAFSTVLMHTSFLTKTVSPALGIPMVIVYLPLFMGFGFLAYFSLVGLTHSLLSVRQEEGKKC